MKAIFPILIAAVYSEIYSGGSGIFLCQYRVFLLELLMVLSFDFVSGGIKFEKCLNFIILILVRQVNMCFHLPLCFNSFQDQISPTLFYACAGCLTYCWHVCEGSFRCLWWSQSAISLLDYSFMIYWSCGQMLLKRHFVEISEIVE